MLTDNDLRELLSFQSEHPVLSISLNTDPSEGSADGYKLRLRSMLKNIDLPRVRDGMHRPVVIDGRNLYDPARMDALGFVYRGVGRGYEGSGVRGEAAAAGSAGAGEPAEGEPSRADGPAVEPEAEA